MTDGFRYPAGTALGDAERVEAAWRKLTLAVHESLVQDALRIRRALRGFV